MVPPDSSVPSIRNNPETADTEMELRNCEFNVIENIIKYYSIAELLTEPLSVTRRQEYLSELNSGR